MIVMLLVFVFIFSVVVCLYNVLQLGKISFLSIGILLFIILIVVLVGVLVINMFGFIVEGLVQGSVEIVCLNVIQSNYVGKVVDFSVLQLIFFFVLKNLFVDLIGVNLIFIISIVIFLVFFGVVVFKLLKEDVEKGQCVLIVIDILQGWVMKLVCLVMQLIFYGVLVLMIKVVVGLNLQDIIKFGGFVVVLYIVLGIMFVVYGLLLVINGVSLLKYFCKVWLVIIFVFISCFSVVFILLNVEV